MQSAQQLFDQLNTDYLAVHKTKEDLFWDTYMATSNDHSGFALAEQTYKQFISDPARLAAVRRPRGGRQGGDAPPAALRHRR